MEIDDLAGSFRKGDLEAFRLIVEKMSRPLLAIAYRYTGDWDDAGDLCQDTWLRVFQRISAYDPARPFKNYLLTIHRNICISHLRQSAKNVRLTVDGMDATIPDVSAMNDPSAMAEKREFAERLREAVTLLSGMQQTVFSCVDIEQRNPSEACRILGMNPSTLRVTLHNARRRLASILRKTEEIG